MNSLVNRINAIKNACTLDWLTTSQSTAWSELQARLTLDDVVNLCGPVGSGKTFIAWLLAKFHQASYDSSLKTLLDDPCRANLAIIDNYPSSRDAYRSLLKQLSLLKRTRVLVITQTPIPDDCYRVQLLFTTADLEQAHQRLLTIDPVIPLPYGGTLHHLINPNLQIS